MNVKEDFLYFDKNGLYCKYGDFYIDPVQPVAKAVVSHAHADHAVSGNHKVYCTEATSAFMRLRYGKNAAADLKIVVYDESFTIGGVEIQVCSGRAHARVGPGGDEI